MNDSMNSEAENFDMVPVSRGPENGGGPGSRSRRVLGVTGAPGEGFGISNKDTDDRTPGSDAEKAEGVRNVIDLNYFVDKLEVIATKMADFPDGDGQAKIVEAKGELEAEYTYIDLDGYLKSGMDRIKGKDKEETRKKRNIELGKRKAVLREMIPDLRNGEIDDDQEKILNKMGIELGDFGGAVKIIDIVDEDETPEVEPVEPVEEAEETWRQYIDRELGELHALGGVLEVQGMKKLVKDLMNADEKALAKEVQDRIDQMEKEKTDLTPEQKNKVLNQALIYIFTADPEVRNIQDLSSRLETYAKGEFGKDFRFTLPLDLRTEIEKTVGAESWIEVRNNVGKWSDLLKVPADEVKPNNFNDERLFVGDETEKFFAKAGTVRLPDKDGNIEVIRDMEAAVSMTMSRLMNYFDGVGYADIVKLTVSERFNFYDQLKINRYVGEAAMSILMSNLMLSETKKAADPVVQLVAREKKRVADFKRNGSEADTFARLAIQDILIESPVGIYEADGKLSTHGEDELTVRLQRSMPSRLIPTGLSGDGRGKLVGPPPSWLKWKTSHAMSVAQRKAENTLNNTDLDTLPRANDRATRMKLLADAFEINTFITDTVKSDATFDSLSKLKGKLKGYFTGTLKDAGWVTQDDIVSADFSLGAPGEKRRVYVDELVGKATFEIGKAYTFSHSVLDSNNGESAKLPDNMTMMNDLERLLKMVSDQIDQDELSDFVYGYENKLMQLRNLLHRGLVDDNIPVWLARNTSLGVYTKIYLNRLNFCYNAGSWISFKKKLLDQRIVRPKIIPRRGGGGLGVWLRRLWR